MGYASRKGKRPNEYASKSAHSNIIKDITIVEFLKKCSLPKRAEEIDFTNHEILEFNDIENNPINYIIAIDGGYSEVSVRKEFPSATISFFQFGALIFSVKDLEKISIKPFIDPEDISKLKNIQRIKLSIPTKNIMLANENSLIDSVRKAIFDFFIKESNGNNFIETLKWFIFEEYNTGVSELNLSSVSTI